MMKTNFGWVAGFAHKCNSDLYCRFLLQRWNCLDRQTRPRPRCCQTLHCWSPEFSYFVWLAVAILGPRQPIVDFDSPGKWIIFGSCWIRQCVIDGGLSSRDDQPAGSNQFNYSSAWTAISTFLASYWKNCYWKSRAAFAPSPTIIFANNSNWPCCSTSIMHVCSQLSLNLSLRSCLHFDFTQANLTCFAGKIEWYHVRLGDRCRRVSSFLASLSQIFAEGQRGWVFRRIRILCQSEPSLPFASVSCSPGSTHNFDLYLLLWWAADSTIANNVGPSHATITIS